MLVDYLGFSTYPIELINCSRARCFSDSDSTTVPLMLKLFPLSAMLFFKDTFRGAPYVYVRSCVILESIRPSSFIIKELDLQIIESSGASTVWCAYDVSSCIDFNKPLAVPLLGIACYAELVKS